MSPSVRRPAKPGKPSAVPDGFPLWPHPSGRWCKKVHNKAHYFGKVADDPNGKAALDEWLRVKDDLLAGRAKRPKGEGVELRDVVNAFLTAKLRAVESRELRPASFAEYHGACARLVGFFGARRPVSDITADDFGAFRRELAGCYGPLALTKRIQIVRSVFKHAWESGQIESLPRYGPSFKKPAARVLRKARAEQADRLFSAAEIRALLGAAGPQLRAMILLGIGCGMGNTDVAELPISAVDFKTGILSFARPKTGIPRRAVLWAETIEALQRAIAARPKPKAPADDKLMLLTHRGEPWMRFKPKGDGAGSWINSVGQEFKKLLKRIGLRRPGASFYSLRHTYRSVVDELPDRPAIDLTMGHQDANDMRTHYVARIDDKRLAVVAAHVRAWLFEGGEPKV